MKEERFLCYREKIDFLVESLESIPDTPKNDIEVSGVFYKMHTSIEASMDLLAMILKDLGKKVEDDYSNIDNLMDSGLISEVLARGLKKCNGLRNHLVHRYNGVDERIALGALEDIKRFIYWFLDVVEDFLRESKKD